MSAIGSYAVLRRDAVAECAARATEIRTESSGRWLFRKTKLVGREEFDLAWEQALVEEIDFELSGYALGTYLDAQEEVNHIPLKSDEVPLARALRNAFTAAFVFESPHTFPELDSGRLAAWCQDEYGEEAEGALPVFEASHAFFREGLAKVDEANLVVFIIG